MYHEVHGKGPRLLYIGGTGGDLRVTPMAGHPLTRHFTVLAYDQRGLGRTTKPDQPYTMTDYADDAAGLLDALGWGRAHVVGVSFGGMVAQHLAVRHAERVDRLVLACTSSGGDGGSSADLLTLSRLPDAERATISLGLMDTRFRPGGPLPPGLESLIERFSERPQLSGEDAVGARRQLEARADHDVWEVLPDIATPTLVIGGRHDGIAPPDNLRAIGSRIPDARIELCDGGHLFMLQDPEAWPLMIEFLNAGGA